MNTSILEPDTQAVNSHRILKRIPHPFSNAFDQIKQFNVFSKQLAGIKVNSESVKLQKTYNIPIAYDPIQADSNTGNVD